MSIALLLAVSDRRAEAALVQAFESSDHGVTVVRRCADMADLLATAAAGSARAVVVSHDLRRLDRDALARFAALRVAVVVLLPDDDEDAERRVRQLGVVQMLPVSAGAPAVAALVTDAVRGGTSAPAMSGMADVSAALPSFESFEMDDEQAPDPEAAPGRVIAVWGPTGAPGRTTIATTLAAELAAAGESTMLIDADVYGGAVAQTLGLLDEAPGLAAAARAANNGTLDVPSLAQLARAVNPQLRVLTGITRAERWTELRPAAIDNVLALARRLVAFTVVDCGFCIEEDEELAFDTMAPRRNGATVAVLSEADIVAVVGAADPVSLQRLVRGLAHLSETVPGARTSVIINKVRKTLLAADPEREIAAALERYAGVSPAAFVPFDQKSLDAALMAGRSLTEAAAESPAAAAIRRYALELAGHSIPTGRKRIAAWRGRG